MSSGRRVRHLTDPSGLKLPDQLLLGKSKLADFDAAFGTKPASIPAGAADARQFQLSRSRMTPSDTTATPGIAATLLLETAR